jgi:hypothetical protein
MCAQELNEQTREVRDAMRGLDVDAMRVQIASEKEGERAKSCRIAVSLNEYERPQRRGLRDIVPLRENCRCYTETTHAQ